MNRPNVIWLWPDDDTCHAIGLEIEGAVRYVRQPVPQSLNDFERDENEEDDDPLMDWSEDP